MKIHVMRSVVAVVISLALVGQDDSSIKVGDLIRLHASGDGGIPLVETEADYRGLLMALRLRKYPSRYLRDITPPGVLVEVVGLRSDRGYPLAAPAAIVEIAEGLEKGDRFWVAQQYIRPKDMKPPRGEVRLPDFVFRPDPTYRHEIGDVCNLHSDDRKMIPLALNREAFGRIAATLASRGGEPVDISGPGIIEGGQDRQVKIVRIHPGSIRAVECLILDGPDEGRYVWAPMRFVVRYDVQILYPKSSRKRAG